MVQQKMMVTKPFKVGHRSQYRQPRGSPAERAMSYKSHEIKCLKARPGYLKSKSANFGACLVVL